MIGVVVRNLIVAHQPVYALGEWAAPYQPGLLDLGPTDAAALNDDRVGRMLDRLFDADRATLITEVVLRSIREFDIELSQLHNDSTTVTFSGVYQGATGRARGGKATPVITHGHNKDHRPDLKQLLLGHGRQHRRVPRPARDPRPRKRHLMSIELLQAHYGLSRMPFGRDLAPQMLHRSAGHNEAVARITWSIGERALGVITGEVGQF